MANDHPDDVAKTKSIWAILMMLFGGIVVIVCGYYIVYLLYTFFEIGRSDPWPQLIVIPICFVPPFVVGFLLGLSLLMAGVNRYFY